MRWVALLLTALAVPLAAVGEEATLRGWYVGGGPALNNVFTNEDSDYGYGSSERGSSDTGFIFNGGYRFNRYLAIEAGYLDGAEPRFQSISIAPGGNVLYETDITQKTEAIEASVVGIFPFLKIWEIYVKGGIAAWDASARQRLMPLPGFGAPAIEQTVARDGVDLLVGVGFGVTVWRNLHLRFEVQAFRTDDALLFVEGDGREARFDSFTAEVHWRFGDDW
ncbi:MAG: porin family protein [Gammaproteobacteria bacterium]|nr:porin family protein [Gammaproteobacteria bacterium]NND37059.1 outer membrane beta-barrel protein [Gammaproteobacteria bacterium]